MYEAKFNTSTGTYDYSKFDQNKLFVVVNGKEPVLTYYGYTFLYPILNEYREKDDNAPLFKTSEDNRFNLTYSGELAYNNFIRQNTISNNTKLKYNKSIIEGFGSVLEKYADYAFEPIFKEDGSLTDRGQRALENYIYLNSIDDINILDNKNMWPNPPINDIYELETNPIASKFAYNLSRKEKDLLSEEGNSKLPEGPIFDLLGELTVKGWGLVLKRYWNNVYVPEYIRINGEFEDTILDKSIIDEVDFFDLVKNDVFTDKGREVLAYFRSIKDFIPRKLLKVFQEKLENEFQKLEAKSHNNALEYLVKTFDPCLYLNKPDTYYYMNPNLDCSGLGYKNYEIDREEFKQGISNRYYGYLVPTQGEYKNVGIQAINNKYDPNVSETLRLRRIDILNYIAGNELQYKPTHLNTVSLKFYPANDSIERSIINEAKSCNDKLNKFDTDPGRRLSNAAIIMGGSMFFFYLAPIVGFVNYLNEKNYRKKLLDNVFEKFSTWMQYSKMSNKSNSQSSKPIDIEIKKSDFIDLPFTSTMSDITSKYFSSWVSERSFFAALGYPDATTIIKSDRDIAENAKNKELDRIFDQIDLSKYGISECDVYQILKNAYPVSAFAQFGYKNTLDEIRSEYPESLILSRSREEIFPSDLVKDEKYTENETKNAEFDQMMKRSKYPFPSIMPPFNFEVQKKSSMTSTNTIKGSFSSSYERNDPDFLMAHPNVLQVEMNRR